MDTIAYYPIFALKRETNEMKEITDCINGGKRE